MNYEALGKYHHLKQLRQQDLLKMQARAPTILALGHDLEYYSPSSHDRLGERLARAKAVLPEIEALQARVVEYGAEMERLKREYNLSE